MVHVFAVAKALSGLKSKEQESEDKFVNNMEELVRKDMIKQKGAIDNKLKNKQKLSDFEEWLVQQPEYMQL